VAVAKENSHRIRAGQASSVKRSLRTCVINVPFLALFDAANRRKRKARDAATTGTPLQGAANAFVRMLTGGLLVRTTWVVSGVHRRGAGHFCRPIVSERLTGTYERPGSRAISPAVAAAAGSSQPTMASSATLAVLGQAARMR
jgi:hypothetical protein